MAGLLIIFIILILILLCVAFCGCCPCGNPERYYRHTGRNYGRCNCDECYEDDFRKQSEISHKANIRQEKG